MSSTKHQLRKPIRRRRRKKKKPFLDRLARFVGMGLTVIVLTTVAVVFALRFVNPPLNYYQAQEWMRIGALKREWVLIDVLPRYVIQSAIAAEDAKFCEHIGFDVDAIRAALNDTERFRGGSTISQQTAKNVFLWQERSWVRKGVEVVFTGLVEALWGKRRIMEVYLNVAEFDEGVFGIGAASKHYFGVEASDLSRTQAARLMAILPSPKRRSAARPGPLTARRTSQIASGARLVARQRGDACI
ncbi:monofunctional biosynthetic peptidoglycan transglycosylase [Halovulum sp. GXIMD14793]